MGHIHKVLAIALLTTCLLACEDSAVENAPAADQITSSETDRTMQMWSRSCALCHVDGNAGAPRMGHAEEWLTRLEQGQEVLLAHTIEGINNMPPLGYCMACEREDFITMINFMTANLNDSATQSSTLGNTP